MHLRELRFDELLRTPLRRSSQNSYSTHSVNKGRRKYGSLTHWEFTPGVGFLAHPQQQTTPRGGSLRSRRHAPRQLRAGLG
jgi:hypothetical protein